MLGRPALGRPWIFREMAHYLATGMRIARKHLGWYLRDQPGGEAFRAAVNRVDSAAEQAALTREFLDGRDQRVWSLVA